MKNVYFLGQRNFLFVHKFLSLFLNEILQSEIMQKSRSVQTSLSLLQLLMSNRVQFECLQCCVPPDFVPAGIYLLKVNNRNTRTMCKVRLKLTTDAIRLTTVFIVNFEHISHLVLVFLLLTLNM